MQKDNFISAFHFLLSAILIVLLVSCTQKQDLVGKWQEAGKKSTIEFHKDGTFNAVDDMGMAVSGKYFLQENGAVRFEITHEGNAPEIVEGKLILQGDELTLISPDNKETEKYKRDQ
jgi:hypothetical protein